MIETAQALRVGQVWPMAPPNPYRWPEPTEIVYPMKPTDTFESGVLFSARRGQVKLEQHSDRVVIEWLPEPGHWVIRRLPPPAVERSDHIPKEPQSTAWRRSARKHQSLWRTSRGWPAGHQRIGRGPALRSIGSRVELVYARENGCNFLTSAALSAVRDRLSAPQPYETIDTDRLWCDLLSSMPMCFNLFGPLAKDRTLAASAVAAWFPDMMLPDSQVIVHLEWSPGRRDPQWLGDRTAFDTMIEVVAPSARNLIGIETKYHEFPTSGSSAGEIPPRYLEVARAAGLTEDGDCSRFWGNRLEQIWRDHLLALACHQHPTGWSRVRSVVVAPSGNAIWSSLVAEYTSQVSASARPTIEYMSLEELLDAGGLPHADLMRARYLPSATADEPVANTGERS